MVGDWNGVTEPPRQRLTQQPESEWSAPFPTTFKTHHGTKTASHLPGSPFGEAPDPRNGVARHPPFGPM